MQATLKEMQNDCNGDIINNCSPAVPILVVGQGPDGKMQKVKAMLSPEEKRENAVWHNGRAAMVTDILQKFFGGDQ